jgi:ribonuclease BN (tRNA processing enzyme)
MTPSIVFLGTGNADISLQKNTASVLIQLDKTNILFDIGRGIANALFRYGIRQDDLEHIIISHFHTDHISDLLPYLHSARQSGDKRTKPLNIYGPTGLKDFMLKIIGIMEYLDLEKNPFEFPINTFEIESNSKVVIDNHEFEFVSLPPANNHGLKFSVNDKTVAITGDSYFHNEEKEFVNNSDIAIIDSSHLNSDEIIQFDKQF